MCINCALQDVYKTAEAIRSLGYEVTKEPGPLPGLGTKITASVDPDGWKVKPQASADCELQLSLLLDKWFQQ